MVGIVEDADDFNAESANSFLKTLEEPPTGAILLLIATGTDRQLPDHSLALPDRPVRAARSHRSRDDSGGAGHC